MTKRACIYFRKFH